MCPGMQLLLNVVRLSLGLDRLKIQRLEVELGLEQRERFKRQSATIKTDGGENDRKDRVRNGKVLLTHFTLQALKEPVKDDSSHQCRRQIHLYIDNRQKKENLP